MKGLIALMAKQASFNLNIKVVICSLHDNILSRVKPRNFVLFMLLSIEFDVIISIEILFCFLAKKKLEKLCFIIVHCK